MKEAYLEASQEYISFLIDENKELRKKLQSYDVACQQIRDAIANKPDDDEHGNVGKRSEWLDHIIMECRVALAGVGYPMFTLPDHQSGWQPAWRRMDG